MTAPASIGSPACVMTPVTRPSAARTSSTGVRVRMVTPRCSNSSRMARITFTQRSVPMWRIGTGMKRKDAIAARFSRASISSPSDP